LILDITATADTTRCPLTLPVSN